MSDNSALAKKLFHLWPHREHESGPIRGLCCRVGLHQWRPLDLTEFAPGRDVRFCFWCSRIKIDGVIHEP